MQWKTIFSWSLSLIFMVLIVQTNAASRRQYNFNPGWKVFVGDSDGFEEPAFNDNEWKNVTLPYAWNEDEAFKEDIHDLSTGIAWYRKQFILPAASENKKVFLEFEGVRQAAGVYLNGEFIGRHENGVMAFGFDITNAVKPAPAENVLAVKTDNDWGYREKSTNSTYQWSDRNFNCNYGGITKNVKLHLTEKLYQTLPLYSWLETTGVYVYADDFDIEAGTANINAESQVRNEYDTERTFQYEVEVRDLEGKKVALFEGPSRTVDVAETVTVKASKKLDNLHYWSWGYGYLYNVITRLKVDGHVIDEVTTRTGFRKTAYENGMFKLNDRVLQIKGYAQRTTNEWPAIGGSVPAWLSDYSNRLMVQSNGNTVRWMHITPWKQDVESCDRAGLMQLMPAGDSESDVNGRRWEQRVEVMRDAIIYNRNNPSVVFYEGGNETISEQHMAELVSVRDQYDPHGGRAMGCREMLASKVAEWGGEMLYVNKSGHIPLFATEYNRNEGLRRYWDNDSPPYHRNGSGRGQGGSYNMNQDAFAIEDVVRWYEYWRERPGTGDRVSAGGLNIVFSDTNTHFRGEENYRRSGEVDPMRIPKDAYFAHQVMWDGWIGSENPHAVILGHWNYSPNVVKDVTVVSSAEAVELFVNEESLGRGIQSNRYLFTFKDVTWKPGTIKAIGYDGEGKAVCEATHTTVDEPVAIKLTPIMNPTGWKADGHDLAMIQVEAVDAKGRRNPIAFNEIDFELEGPAEWRGGIAKGPDNYILSKTLPVELGINRVLIRSIPEAGTVKLTASSEGLKSATIELQTQPIEFVGGLSPQLPSDGLPVYLECGPTPEAVSLQITRHSLEIQKVEAGSSPQEASNVFDDNESSAWRSSGDVQDAWIRLDLSEPQKINQISLKVRGHRTTAYPIRVAIDGKQVWTGSVGRTLTYDTFSFDPVKGRSVMIAMAGVTHVEDAFGEIVEITGVRDQSGQRGGRGRLELIEVDIYGPVQDELE